MWHQAEQEKLILNKFQKQFHLRIPVSQHCIAVTSVKHQDIFKEEDPFSVKYWYYAIVKNFEEK